MEGLVAGPTVRGRQHLVRELSPLKDRTAVVGIGQTAFGKGLDDSELSLACQAVSLAIDDAGLTPGDVDGLAMFSMEDGREVDVARNVGLGDITFFSQVGYGGGAGCGVVGHAAMAVATGQCDVAVAWRARKRAAKMSRPWAQVSQRLAGHQQWSRPFGVVRPVDEIALLTRRTMHEYGYTRDHLANVAIGLSQAREPQPERDDGPQGAHPRAVHGRAVDLRAALPLRQLPRDRRRAGDRDHVGGARPRPPPAAGVRARVRAEHPAAAPGDDQLLQRRPAPRAVVGVRQPALGTVGHPARRRPRRAALRRVQPARPAVPGGLRVLQAG